ncbi:hypothetical protein ACFWBR_27005 [Streptomyces sp. NPDC060006]|uniref:hypothetical protein n=1 Tax=unclassified Streptomyces TaxID=2593676 RepID=UPI0036AF730F
MNRKPISRRTAVVVATAVIAALGAGTAGFVAYQESDEGNAAVGETAEMHLTFDADFSVDTNLAGGAEDLFYGKVTALKGQKDLGVGPETQYAVAVQRVFKGDVTGTVVVNQLGGTDEEGVLLLPEDDHLLQVGKRYLFATNYNEEQRFNTLIPVHGDQPIPDTEAGAPGVPDSDGNGQATMSDRWVAAVRDQADLSTAPPEPEPTEEPEEDPTPKASPTPGS